MKRLYDVKKRYKKLHDEYDGLYEANLALARKNIALKEEVERLDKQLHDDFTRSNNPIQRMKAYFEMHEPTYFSVGKLDTPGGFVVRARFIQIDTFVAVKVFATDDEAYNKMAAEELLEKLNEKL
jgi:hypothetical protein